MHRSTVRTLGAAGAAALLAATLAAGTGPAFADPIHEPILVEAVSAMDDSPEKEVPVQCPGAALVFAAGAVVGGSAAGTGHVVITQITPNAQLTAAMVRAVARAGQTGPWSLTAQIICEDSANPLYRVASTTTGQSEATATCEDGTKVFGTGFRVVGNPDQVAVTTVAPDADLGVVRVAIGGDALQAEVTAYAICREQTGRMRRVAAVSPAGNEWPRVLTVDDTTDGRIYSVGGDAGDQPGAFLDALALRPGIAGGGIRAVLAEPFAQTAARADDEGGQTTAYGILLGSFH